MVRFMMLGGLLALAACGSGDNDDPLADYNDDAARAVRIVAETQNLAQTSAALMPVRGRAEYDGVVGLAFGDESASLERADVIGDLDLDADFVAGTIRGEMDDFNTRGGRELQGELRVTVARIDGSGFSGTARGTLVGGARTRRAGSMRRSKAGSLGLGRMPCRGPGPGPVPAATCRRCSADSVTWTETRVSSAGRAFLGLKGFLHDPSGPSLQPLSSGHALVPLLRHDTIVNDGVPSDRITIGGLPFRVSDDSRARSGVLRGLRYAGWQSLSFGRAARLRLAHSYSAEAEPKHGFHRLSAGVRACTARPLERWTSVKGCLSGFYDDDSVDAETAVTGEIGMRRLFRTPVGFHQAQVTLARTHQDDHRKDAIHLTSHTLAKAGLFGLDVSLGERVTAQNTLSILVAASWSGTLGRSG